MTMNFKKTFICMLSLFTAMPVFGGSDTSSNREQPPSFLDYQGLDLRGKDLRCGNFDGISFKGALFDDSTRVAGASFHGARYVPRDVLMRAEAGREHTDCKNHSVFVDNTKEGMREEEWGYGHQPDCDFCGGVTREIEQVEDLSDHFPENDDSMPLWKKVAAPVVVLVTGLSLLLWNRIRNNGNHQPQAHGNHAGARDGGRPQDQAGAFSASGDGGAGAGNGGGDGGAGAGNADGAAVAMSLWDTSGAGQGPVGGDGDAGAGNGDDGAGAAGAGETLPGARNGDGEWVYVSDLVKKCLNDPKVSKKKVLGLRVRLALNKDIVLNKIVQYFKGVDLRSNADALGEQMQRLGALLGISIVKITEGDVPPEGVDLPGKPSIRAIPFANVKDRALNGFVSQLNRLGYTLAGFAPSGGDAGAAGADVVGGASAGNADGAAVAMSLGNTSGAGQGPAGGDGDAGAGNGDDGGGADEEIGLSSGLGAGGVDGPTTP